MSAASEASLLRAVSAALKPFDTDLADLEKRAKAHDERLQAHSKQAEEHEQADARRFLQAQQGIADLHQELEYVKNHINLVHDQLIDGFRALNVVINKRDPNEVTPPRRGRNGR